MNTPKTLLEIAGASPTIAQWSQAVLLLVDPQVEYVSGRLPLAGGETAIGECARLLALAREAHAPVFHIVHHGRPGGAVFDPEGPFVREMPLLAPRESEFVVTKSLPNSFSHTELDASIRTTGRRQLVIAGFATHMCVSATARAALDLGYATTVVASACATRDLPGPLGGTIPAATVHEVALAELADRFATVVASPAVWSIEGVSP